MTVCAKIVLTRRGSPHGRGRTGFPFIDACMRSVTATGWLNFRMRAMLMSFASYHLWLLGEKHLCIWPVYLPITNRAFIMRRRKCSLAPPDQHYANISVETKPGRRPQRPVFAQWIRNRASTYSSYSHPLGGTRQGPISRSDYRRTSYPENSG